MTIASKEKNWKNYALWAIQIVLALAFLAAGGAKLVGAEEMIALYETIGVGQWFRFVTGIIEVGSAILLLWPGKAAIGAALLVCTMTGAVLAHIFIVGPSLVPAFVLGILAAIVAYFRR